MYVVEIFMVYLDRAGQKLFTMKWKKKMKMKMPTSEYARAFRFLIVFRHAVMLFFSLPLSVSPSLASICRRW